MGNIRINVVVAACRHPQSASCLNLSNYVSAGRGFEEIQRCMMRTRILMTKESRVVRGGTG